MSKFFSPSRSAALALCFSLTARSGGGGGSLSFQSGRDSDGIPDAIEVREGTGVEDPDDPYPGGALDVSEATGPGPDALPDGLERYLVERGAVAPVSATTGTDLDGIPDYLEVRTGSDFMDFTSPLAGGAGDLENASGPALDGVSDGLEFVLLDLGAVAPLTLATDTDGDFLPDVQEVRSGSDPLDAEDPAFGQAFDLDHDGIPDALELANLSAPLDRNFPVFEGDLDDDGGANGPDGDAFPDGLEGFLLSGGAIAPVTTLSDTDGDGIGDFAEVLGNTDPFDPDEPLVDGHLDSDGDGVSDALERFLVDEGATGPITAATDSDGDRYPDVLELRTGFNPFDATSPGLFDHFDIDGDGLVDLVEVAGSGDPQDADSPVFGGAQDINELSGPGNDPLSDAVEAELVLRGATAPVTALTDTDLDGITDFLELRLASNPLDANDPLTGGNLDLNAATGVLGDGITDALEAVLVGLGSQAPISDTTASDGDFIPDVIEMITGTEPFNEGDPAAGRVSDVDGDGAPDYYELLFGADPLDPDSPIPGGALDTDADGLSDTFENLLAADGTAQPVDPTSDSDGDGLADYLEVRFARDARDVNDPVVGGGDTEDRTGPPGDGISDALELYLVRAGAAAPITTTTDTDGDAITDFIEVALLFDPFDSRVPLENGSDDDDGDGVSNALEFVLERLGTLQPIDGATDSDADAVPDYLELLAGDDPYDRDNPVVGGDLDGNGNGLADSIEKVLEQLGAELPVTFATDSDEDGAPDAFEISLGSNPLLGDHPVIDGGLDLNDATGPPDILSDALEELLIRAGAVAPVTLATDSDLDRAPDYLEVPGGGDPLDGDHPVPSGAADSDGDRLSDSVEFILARLGAPTPLTVFSDSDLDGAPDYLEVFAAHHPLRDDDPVSPFDKIDATGPPGDGITDALEFLLLELGTPGPVRASSDTDGDGLPDYLETRIGANPYNVTDPFAIGDIDDNDSTGPSGDPITDALEGYLLLAGATGPITTATDSDGDGAPDYLEIFRGSNPFDVTDRPPVGTAPRAEDVRIEGIPLAGETLLARYAYVDDDADPEADTEIRWLRTPDGSSTPVEIPGTRNMTSYVLLESDYDSTLRLEVTPRSLLAFPEATAEGTTIGIDFPAPFPTLPAGEGGPGGVGLFPEETPLVTWFVPDRGVEVTENAGRLLIESMEDLSGTGFNASKTTDPRRPELVLGASPTGSPAIRYEGGQTLVFNRPIQEGFVIYVSVRTTSTASGFSWPQSPGLVGGGISGGLGLDFHLGINGGKGLWVIADSELEGTIDVADGVPHVLEAIRTTGLGRGRLTVDAVLDGVSVSVPNSLSDPPVLYLGSANASQGFWDGDIFEAAMFSRTLDEVERALVREAFAARCGATLDGSRYDHGATHPGELVGIGAVGARTLETSESEGIVRISNPTALDPDDFLILGTDLIRDFSRSSEVPAPLTERLARTWAVTVTDGGAGDGVGLVDLRFRVGGLFLSPVAEDFALLLDADGDFSDAEVFSGTAVYDSDANTIEFQGVTLQDGVRLALAVTPL